MIGKWFRTVGQRVILRLFDASDSSKLIILNSADQSVLEILSGGAITFRERSAPGTPASGFATIYTKTDGLLYIKDDAGSEVSLSITDHGALGGLGDDDHGAVYPNLGATETITGAWTFSNTLTASTSVSGWLPFVCGAARPWPLSANTSSVFVASLPRTVTIDNWFQAVYVATTNDGSNYWTLDLEDMASNNITSPTTAGESADTWALLSSTSIGTSKGTGDIGLKIDLAKTGSPGDIYLAAPAVYCV